MLLLPGQDPALQLLLQLMGTKGQCREAAALLNVGISMPRTSLAGSKSCTSPQSVLHRPIWDHSFFSRAEPTLERVFCSFARSFSSFSRFPPRLAKRLGSVAFL